MNEPHPPLFEQLLGPEPPHVECGVAVMQYGMRGTSMVVGCTTAAETAVTTMELEEWNVLLQAVTRQADLLVWDSLVTFQVKNPHKAHHEHEDAYRRCTAAMLAVVRGRRRRLSLAAAAALAGTVLSIVFLYLLPADDLASRVVTALLPLATLACGGAFLYYVALRYMLLAPVRSLDRPLNSAEFQIDRPESEEPLPPVRE